MTGSERRHQLIDIARSLFAERGYEGASIEEIAQRANVSKPVVYEHFGGKEGLYAVVVDREMSALLDGITSSLTNAGRDQLGHLFQPAQRRRQPGQLHPGRRLRPSRPGSGPGAALRPGFGRLGVDDGPVVA
jgi:AcrR family transcriptional regulator